jgi:hypothetical protein
VKKAEKEELPLFIMDRNPLFVAIFVLISALVVYAGYLLLKDVNPWGFIVLVPGAILSFQSLWFILNPFGNIYRDKIEIQQSLVHHKTRYIVDIKKITETDAGKLYITFRDDEIEYLNTYGIKNSHRDVLKKELETLVSQVVLSD